jgi:hypothetical protein
MPGLLKSENSEADAGKVNAQLEVLVSLLLFSLLGCRFLLCSRSEWIID